MKTLQTKDINAQSPDIHIQILKAGLNTFP